MGGSGFWQNKAMRTKDTVKELPLRRHDCDSSVRDLHTETM